jgi:hypothetical protein
LAAEATVGPEGADIEGWPGAYKGGKPEAVGFDYTFEVAGITGDVKEGGGQVGAILLKDTDGVLFFAIGICKCDRVSARDVFCRWGPGFVEAPGCCRGGGYRSGLTGSVLTAEYARECAVLYPEGKLVVELVQGDKKGVGGLADGPTFEEFAGVAEE